MNKSVGEWFMGMMAVLKDSSLVLRPIEALDRLSENRMSERGMIAQAFEFTGINCIEGDYFEFGLWRGKTFRYAHQMKRRYQRNNMLLLGFDSFQGLPKADDEKDNIWHAGQFQCSEQELTKILRWSGFRREEYELFGGFYEDILNERLHQRLVGRKAAIIYIDCDLYSSTREVLEFIQRYLDNGSVVCFDDFYCYKSSPDKGEQRALAEFLCKHERFKFIPYISYSPVGQSFIVRLE